MSENRTIMGSVKINEGLHFTYHYLVKAAKLQCLEPVHIETKWLIKVN